MKRKNRRVEVFDENHYDITEKQLNFQKKISLS